LVRAVYPGSFDPVTLGHLDIAVRASRLFDEVVVAVYDAPPKRLLFETAERIDLWRGALPAGVSNVTVVPYKGLTVDLARAIGASVLVRGLRALSDFEYELEMNLTNKRMSPDVESVFLMSSHEYLYLSSTRIKEVWGLGHRLRDMPSLQGFPRARTDQRTEGGGAIDILHLIDRLDTLISESMPIPLTASIVVDRDRVLELIDEMRAAIPEDIQHAADVLRSQEDLLNEARQAAERIRAEAETAYRLKLDQHELVQAARLQVETIVSQSNQKARDLVDQAQREIAGRRRELDDYSLNLLRRLESTLSGQITAVRTGIDTIMQDAPRGPGGGAAKGGGL